MPSDLIEPEYEKRNLSGFYSAPRKCFYCAMRFEGRNDFWNHVLREHPEHAHVPIGNPGRPE